MGNAFITTVIYIIIIGYLEGKVCIVKAVIRVLIQREQFLRFLGNKRKSSSTKTIIELIGECTMQHISLNGFLSSVNRRIPLFSAVVMIIYSGLYESETTRSQVIDECFLGN